MGLLRGIARTAAIAGTATAVSNRVSRRQGNRWAAKEQAAEQEQQAQQPPPQQYAQPQYAPPPQQYAQPQYAQPQYAPAPQYAQPPAEAPVAEPLSTDDMLEQLKKLGELKEAGVLTDAEFQASKAKILGS